MSNNKKIKVLLKIAHKFNENNISWAVGGSLLLYLKGAINVFNDIDIMIMEKDIYKAKVILLKMGSLIESHKGGNYKTRHFLEFSIDDVDVDVMSGFIIVANGVDHDCSLEAGKALEDIFISGEKIPLQSLKDWRRYYLLMGREEKVELIDKYLNE